MDEKKTSSVKSLQKAMEVLKILSFEENELSIPELAYKLDLPKATVHRILVTLERGGFVEQDSVSNNYRLGTIILTMANQVLSKLDLRNVARLPLINLVKETGESAYIAVLSGDDVVYIDKVDNHRTFTLNTEIGNRTPVHTSALGKILLASLPESELENILCRPFYKKLPRFTRNTITSIEHLREELIKVKLQGYAFDNEEFEEGLQCLAVPIKNYLGHVVASLSLAGPTSRVNNDSIEFLLKNAKKTGDEISSRLGYNRSEKKYKHKNERGNEG